MTAIGALRDGEITVMAGDSGAFDDQSAIVSLNSKVWKVGDWLVGVSGSFRIMEIAQTAEIGNPYQLRDHLLVQCEKPGFPISADWSILCAGKEGIFEIGSDFSVVKSSENYNGIGSGGPSVIAALCVLEVVDLSPKHRMELAMGAAAKHTAYVRKPFKIVTL
jgi:ATP-dependent protease HslVU (ClpYQ) peptidase subunit